jgi:TM2 domain-containing membrane protein YozV
MNNGRYLLTGTIFSWALGYVGADRFYKGEVILGLLKLITLGGFGIWYIVDAIIWTSELGNHDRNNPSA